VLSLVVFKYSPHGLVTILSVCVGYPEAIYLVARSLQNAHASEIDCGQVAWFFWSTIKRVTVRTCIGSFEGSPKGFVEERGGCLLVFVVFDVLLDVTAVTMLPILVQQSLLMLSCGEGLWMVANQLARDIFLFFAKKFKSASTDDLWTLGATERHNLCQTSLSMGQRVRAW